MKIFSKLGLILCGAVMINSALAGEFLEVRPMFKSGKTITPQLQLLDDNADFNPDRFKVSFKVWTVGTTTYLRRTRERTFAFPPPPCTTPVFLESDFDISFSGSTSTDRVYTGVSLYTECVENSTFEDKESARALIYSGNVDDGTSWMRTWAGSDLLGIDLADWDTDGTVEIMVVMAVEKTSSVSARVVFLDPSTGAVESDKTYTNLLQE